MGDWDRMFDCGVSAESVIDSINRDYFAEQRRAEREARVSRKKIFSTFQEASDWSKNNSGKPFKRSPDGNGFTEV